MGSSICVMSIAVIDRIMQVACSELYVAVHLQRLLLGYPPTYLDACKQLQLYASSKGLQLQS